MSPKSPSKAATSDQTLQAPREKVHEELHPGTKTNAEPGASPRSAGPCIVVIFGASGDLTKRKLLPSLYNLQVNGLLSEEFAVVGVARTEKSNESFRADVADSMKKYATLKVT